MGWLVIVACVVAYLLVGRAVANYLAPVSAAAARRAWGYEDNIRNSFYARYALTIALWPIRLLILAVSRNVPGGLSIFERYDAVSVERRDREQRARIADLERELGVAQRDRWSA